MYISEKDKTTQNVLMKALVDEISGEGIVKTCNVCNIDCPTKSGFVSIFSVIGELHAESVEAVVSMEDEFFTGKSDIAEALLQLGNEDYKKDHASLKNSISKAAVGSVYETKITGGDITCKYVFHTVIPMRNKEYARNANKFEGDIIQTIRNVLQKAATLHCESVALPFMGTSGKILTDLPTVFLPVDSRKFLFLF